MLPLSVYYTKEGTTTLINTTLDETYHSRVGAIQESDYVFIKKGLEVIRRRRTDQITIFEMGFGTGLNAWRTSIWARKYQIPITYLTVEKFPIDEKIINLLNYKKFSNSPEDRLIFDKIHQCHWNEWNELSPFFKINKWEADMCVLTLPHLAKQVDLCFFDAFAPSKQPEVWRVGILRTVYRLLKKQGMLTTYCAQGQFRRNLQLVGFDVHKVEGPPGKREMTQAIK